MNNCMQNGESGYFGFNGFSTEFFREFEFAVEEMGGFGLGFKLLSYRTSFS